LDICAPFGTGIDDLADFDPCQNQVLSRLVNDQKIQKIFFEAKNSSNFLAAEDIYINLTCLMTDVPVDPGLGKWKFQRAMVVNQ
jgi:hypothetical protein